MSTASSTLQLPIPMTRGEATTTAAERPSSTRYALAALSLAMLLSSLGTSIANVALPTLAHAFGATFEQVRWIVLAYLLASTTLIVSVGRLGDRTGRRRLLLAGIALFTLASLLAATAPTLGLLVAARAVQGLGSAAMMALAMALVAETVPMERSGRAMGLLGTTSAIGTALGPSLGGLLIATAGWRAIFVVNVPLGLLALVLAVRFLPRDRSAAPRGRGGVAPTESMLAALRRDGALRARLAQSALVSAVVMATLVVGPFYLSRGLGLDASMVGLVSSAGPLVVALSGMPAGRLSDQFGASRTAVAGLVAMTAGCVLLSRTTLAYGIAGYAAPVAVLTAGYALFQTANNAGVMAGVAANRRGVVAALLNLSRNLGLIAGTSAMGAVFAFGSSATDVATAGPAATSAGLRLTFAVAAALALAALAMARASWSPAPPRSRATTDTGAEGKRTAWTSTS